MVEQPYAYLRRELIEPDWQRRRDHALLLLYLQHDPGRRALLAEGQAWWRSRAGATAPELVR